MKYRLQIVKGYDARTPIFYTSGELSDYVLDPLTDILSISRSVQYRTTVYQAKADFFRIGSITLRLDASRLRWIPLVGWLQSDRDHILTVTTDNDHILWKGYATEVKTTPDAGAEWRFTNLYNRLDDVQIAGDDDDTRSAIPAQDIIDEVRDQLPIFPVVDASTWFDVFRPAENTSARDYLANMLAAQGRILLFDGNGDLEVRAIEPRTSTFPTSGLTITHDDLISVRILDDKKYMYNTIRYEPFGVDDGKIYQGELESYQYPGNFLFRYGRREIDMDFSHLSETDADTAAEQWQGRLIRPKKRALIELADPNRQILLLERIKLELDHVANVPIPIWGEYSVSSIRINLDKDTIELEAEEIQLPVVVVLSAPNFATNAGNDQSWTRNSAITGIQVPEATGLPLPTYTASGLPAGITFNTSSRVLSGAPTATGSGTITVTATNSEGTDNWTVDYTTAVALTVPNWADNTGNDQDWTQNSAITSFTVPAATGNPTPTYSVADLPNGIIFNTGTRLLSGTPTVVGTGTITVTATNSQGTDTWTVDYEITAVAATPNLEFEFSTITINEGGTGTISVRLTSQPAVQAIVTHAITGDISITPTQRGFNTTNWGTYKTFTVTGLEDTDMLDDTASVVFTATGGSTDTGTVTVNITDDDVVVNVAPNFADGTGDAQNWTQNTAISNITVPAATGTPTPTYAASDLPAGISFNTSSRVLSGTPTAVGSGTITITATNSAGSDTWTIGYATTAAVVLTAPNWTDDMGDDQAWTQNSAITSFTVPAATGNPTPAYSVADLPNGITFNTGTRLISGTPTAVGTGTITITATNSQGSDTWTVDYAVTAVIVGVGYQLINLEAAWWDQITGSQRGWEPPTADRPAIIAGLALNGATNITLDAVGFYSTQVVRISFTNGDLSDEFEANGGIRITVGAQSWIFLLDGADTAIPYFWIPDNGAEISEVYDLISSAVAATLEISDDPDADFGTVVLTAPNYADGTGNAQSWTQNTAITNITVPAASGNPAPAYSASGLPSGVSFSTSTRVLSGTPTSTGSGTITITATNSQGSDTWTMTYVIAAEVVLTAPVFADDTGTDQDWTQNTAITSFTVPAATGNPTPAYSVADLPNGIIFNTGSRLLSGTPTVVGSGTITVTATNSVGSDTWTVDYAITAEVITDLLTLADSDDTGLEVDFKALLVASAPGTSGNSPYVDSDRGGTDTPLDGELGLGDDNTVMSRFLRASATEIAINDNNNPAAFDIGPYFTATGDGEDLTLYLQTTADGEVSFSASSQFSTGGGNFVRFTLPADAQTLLDNLDTGDRWIFKAARPIALAIAPNFTDGTGDAQDWTQNSAITAITVPTASGTPAPTYAVVGALPPGIGFNNTTLQISGTPGSTGSGTITIRAENSEGSDDWTVAYTTTAQLVAPNFADGTGDAQDWTQNSAITSFTVPAASGNPTPVYAVVGSLPAGISFSPTTRLISGTPTVSGNGTITIRATNSQGSDDWTVGYSTSAQFTVPNWTNDTGDDVDWTQNTAITNIQVPAATGNPTPTYVASVLPAGISFDTSTRVISGTPTSTGSGTITITATNSQGSDTWTLDYEIAVDGNEQTITLPADWYTEQFGGVAWLRTTPSVSIAIDDSLTGGTDRWIGYVEFASSGTVRLRFASNLTENINNANDDLSSAFEANGSVTITVGSESVTVSLAGADTTEPYVFTPTNSAEVTAFATAVRALPGDQSATLVIRDFTP